MAEIDFKAAPVGDGRTAVASPDSAETSRTLFDSLHLVHAASMVRNSADSSKDEGAMKGDRDSIALAQKTGAYTDELKTYLSHGGDFSDSHGLALGNKMISALRKERDDHADDRKTDLEYAGPRGLPAGLKNEIELYSKNISDNAKLVETAHGDYRSQAILDIQSSANIIAAAIGENKGNNGKDLKDVAEESRVISVDAANLISGKLTPEQNKLVTADINAKLGLIQKELGDLPNEIGYARHDSQAIKAGADLEAVTRSVMQSHSPKAMHQLAGLLDGYHNKAGSGLLDTVFKDRQADLSLEPTYIEANKADNAKNNAAILDFSDPFKKH